MEKKMKKFFVVFVLFFALAIQAEDSSDKQMCDYAKRRNTVDAWKNYLIKFPKGACAAIAENELEEAGVSLPGRYDSDPKDVKSCQMARKKRTVRAWQIYLRDFPRGECATEAKMAIEEIEEEEENARAYAEEQRAEKERKEAEKNARRQAEINAQRDAQNQAYRDQYELDKAARIEEARRKAELEAAREAQREAQREAEEKAAAIAAQQQAERDRAAAMQAQRQGQIANEQAKIESRKTLTGRYWSAQYFGNWHEATRHCETLTEGGYEDWRLPTISELRTLVTYQACSRTYPGGKCPITDSRTSFYWYSKGDCHCNGGKHNPLGDSERMWSSSTCDNGKVWYIFFGSGSIYADKNGDAYDRNYYRCTRD